MYLINDLTKILEYFDNVVDPVKAQQLHSFCISKSICHIAVQIEGHSLTCHCHCFLCRISRILLTTLLSRELQGLLQVVKKTNYLHVTYIYVTDDYILLNI